MAKRPNSHSKFDPFDPVSGYQWASQLKRTIRHRLASEGRSTTHLGSFLTAYYDFRQWDGLLIRARAGVLNSAEVEIVAADSLDPRSVGQIEQRRNRAWEERQAKLRLLFHDDVPEWMVALLDWAAQVRSTDGF